VTSQEDSAELRFRGRGDEAYLSISGYSVSYRVTYYDRVPEQGIEEPVIHVQAIRSGTPAPLWESASLVADGGWTHQGIEFQVQPSSYAVLRLWRLPGLGLTVGGMALCAIFILAAAAAPPVQGVSVEPREGGLVVALHGAGPRLGLRWGRRATALQELIARAVAEPERDFAPGAGE
jgi:hypothetical protein